MSDQSKKILLDATAGIREEYIEDAAAPAAKSRPLWVRFAAAAAVLALLLGSTLLLWPKNSPSADYTPFFAIRAYAQDGGVTTLHTTGDAVALQQGTSDLFPGKQTYTLDISLTDALGNRPDLEESRFRCRHNGDWLEPGMADDEISISWLEDDDFCGYRIVGWCEEIDLIDVTIIDADSRILHQKELWITFDGQYDVNVLVSYDYEPHLTTEQLIAKLLDTEQAYYRLFLASSPIAEYHILRSYGGFVELEQREDAASLLLQRWLKKMEQTELRPMSLIYGDYEGLMLAQTVYWRQLTEDEKAQIAAYDVSRGYPEPEENYYFPGHRIFSFDFKMEEHEPRGCTLEISYNGKVIRSDKGRVQDEHFHIRNIYWAEIVPEDISGWAIVGWFDEPTEVTLSVYKGEELVRQKVMLITPSEDRYDEYQIDILEETP